MWLFVPSPSAPDTADSKSDSLPLSSLSDGSTVLPLTWSGKPMRLRSLRAAWKRAPWMRRLSGLTSPPSTLQHGVEQWIASLRDSPVSRTVTPEAAKASTTSDGSGPASSELFATLVRGLWCSKTSQASFLPADSNPYSDSWPRWGSLRNGECFRREAWAPAIGESACSLWPTATVASSNGNAQTREEATAGQTGGDTIAGAARAWATPMAARKGTESPATLQARREKVGAGCSELTTQAEYWPTPRNNTGPSTDAKHRSVDGAAAMWPTPTTMQTGERTDPEVFAARQARMKERHGSRTGNGCGADLSMASKTWPTPASRDAKGANSELHVTELGGGRKHMDQLANFVAHSSPPAPPTNDGPQSLSSGHGSRQRLNPAFVCWLMGLPPLWTNIERTSFGAEEMALYRCRLQQQLSAFFADSDSQDKAA